MKLFSLVFTLLLSLNLFSQTLIKYDYIETWDWLGGWAVGFGSNTGFYTNAFVSSNLSTALVGSGNGSSPIEEGYYILPNVTGLDPTKLYYFKFRLGSYRFSNPSATTAGVDASDYINVFVSTNGGTTYTSEIRVTGFSNARWDYNTSGNIIKTANGTLTTYTPAVGGNRTSTGDGYSDIQLILPSGISQCTFRIQCRANSAGEEWWLDNFELYEEEALPVELTSFTCLHIDQGNVIKWQTASEHNSSHYILERSTTGEFNENNVVQIIQAAGNSTELLNYVSLDKEYSQTINYYRLTQVDIDGQFEVYGPISINNSFKVKKVVKVVNTLGQQVDETATGVLFEVYEDGTLNKIWRP